MFKKVKINYTKGKLRQIRFFDIPIVQYELTNERKLKNVVFPLFRKPKTERPVAYLKINSKNWRYAIFCMHHWINIVTEMGCDFYILCDDINIEYKLLSEIPFQTSNIKFLRSDRHTFKKYIKNICAKRWINAGYSHLTTYLHAQKYGIKEFWNIDGDDTSFFEEPQVIAKALLKAEEIARQKDYHAFSLDMHRTSFYGLHWTFGITFTRVNMNIFKLISSVKDDKWKHVYYTYVLDSPIPDSNVDSFFTYLKDKNKLKLGTFNINNIYFMHWGICNTLEFFKMLQIAKNNSMLYPIASSIENSDVKIPIFDDVINFDANIDIEKSNEFMKKVLFFYKDHLEHLHKRWQNPDVRRLYEAFE